MICEAITCGRLAYAVHWLYKNDLLLSLIIFSFAYRFAILLFEAFGDIDNGGIPPLFNFRRNNHDPDPVYTETPSTSNPDPVCNETPSTRDPDPVHNDRFNTSDHHPMRNGSDNQDRTPIEEHDDRVSDFSQRCPTSGRQLSDTNSNDLQSVLNTLHADPLFSLCLECSELVPPRLLTRLSMRSRGVRQWALRPFAVVYEREEHGSNISGQEHQDNNSTANENTWKLLGRTETIFYDSHYRFVREFKMRLKRTEAFHKALRVKVFNHRTDRDDMNVRNLIGLAEFALDDIVSEPQLRLKLRLHSSRLVDTGCLLVSADPILERRSEPVVSGGGCDDDDKKIIHIQVSLSSASKGRNRTFFVLSRQLRDNYTPVYRSEIIGGETNLFRPMEMPEVAITGGFSEKLMRLELFQYNERARHTNLGSMQASVKMLKESPVGRGLPWRIVFNRDPNTIDVSHILLADKRMDPNNCRRAAFRLHITDL